MSSPRPRAATTIALAVGGVLLAAAAVELPGRAKRATLAAELEAARADLTRAAARAAEVELLSEEVAACERRAATIGGLSTATGPHATLARVADAADRCGVRLNSLTPRPQAERRTYREWPFVLELEAPFAAAQAFFAELERGDPLAEAVSLTLQPAAPGGGGGSEEEPVRLRGELEFVVYAAPAGAAGG